MANNRTQELINLDLKHVIHPFGIVGSKKGPVLEKAYGVTLEDTDGKKYIEGASQLICNNLGHSRQEIIDAITEQMKLLQYTTQFFELCNPTTIECARKLAELTPGDISHFHFVSDGSEAVDTAIKIALAYWSAKGAFSRRKVISLYGSYHGMGGIGTNVTSPDVGRDFAIVAAPGFIHIPAFTCYRCMLGLKYPECGVQCAKYFEEVIIREQPQTIAAFIAEPVQGSFGMIVPPPEYWPMVEKICRKYNILLIVDEVMTGFCRTGKLFASEHWSVKPDIMTMAKGLTTAYIPAGAVGINDKVYSPLEGKLFVHGHTYSGHPIAMAAANAAMDIYVKEKVWENAAKVGKHMLTRLKNEFLPLKHVGDVEGLGLMIGLELVTDKETKSIPDESLKGELQKLMMDNGLFLRTGGYPGFRVEIGPPCTVTVEEADMILDTLYTILEKFEVK